jgi:acyl transferase domain-containing protein/thioesterase domain-containing protein
MADFQVGDLLGKIAVVGMAGRYPQAWNVAEFWGNLVEGKECITFFSDDELRATGISTELLSRANYVKAQGVCPGTFLFDASFFNYAPREAEFLDPQHRVFLECAWEALENAGYDPSDYPGRIGLFAGCGATHYLAQLLNVPGIHKLADAFTLATYNDKDFLATRVGYKLNLRGPCISVQTACSTSLVSIVAACQSLLSFQSDIAMGGGVTLITQETGGYLYQEGGIHSPDGHCRAFDAEGRGIVGGAGAGVVVLKRLEDALADRDTIRAVIIGMGINNDGSARVGYSAPGVNGQAEVASDAIAMAGINPETIQYVECHGTATPMGDPIEIAALTRAFRAYTEKKNFCAVGSVKTNVGHTDAASGVAGFTKAVLALENKLIPPSLHFRKPNPDIDFANSPFYVNTELQEWKASESPRRAGVSSFGLGGTNAHVVLEEAPEQKPSLGDRPWNLLVWSAKTESAAEKIGANLARHLTVHPDDSLSDAAYTLQVGRKLFPHRRAVVCQDTQDAIAALKASSPERLLAGYREQEPGPVVFLFPGQGPQYVNMGRQLYLHERIFREQVDLCAEILKQHLDLDPRDVLYPAPGREEQAAMLLDQIKYTTPILFTVEYALAKLWLEWGLKPAGMIGHSTGEYAAACLAGVFSLEDALRLVSARGRLMQQTPEGCMAGVLLPEEELVPLLASVGRISVAAINSPSACVVSGCEPAMVELERMLTEREVLHRRLHVSCAAHSEMMDPILDDFRKELEKTSFNAPSLRYVSCVSGNWIRPAEATDPEYWVRHVRQTVRFADGVGQLLQEPGCTLLEVGPARMLTSLVTKHPLRSAEHVALSSLPHPKEDQQSDLEFLLSTAAQLWLEGVTFNWTALHDGENPHRIPLPSYPFERQHFQLTGGRTRKPSAQDETSAPPPLSACEPARSDGTPSSSTLLAARHARPKLRTPYVGPQNDLERALEGIWQDSLGIQSPGVNDSFVSLGGHSLLAIQVAARIRALFEIELSLASLYKSPTIAGLAQLIAGEMKKRKTSAAASAKNGEHKPSPLVPIREEGTLPPLFLVHPVGGGVMAYHDLAKYLSAELPVYALQNHDSGSEDSPTIEDMGARYVAAIRSVRPEGPYLLGGASMGGTVAFEMALQLSEQGQEVVLVAMLDTPARVIPHMRGLETYSAQAVELNLMASIIASGQGKEFKMKLSDLDRLGPAEQAECVLQKLREQQLAPANLGVSSLQQALATFKKNLNALERYEPKAYGGPVALLRATEVSPNMKETAAELCDDPAFGWQAYCAQPVLVRWVPGDHAHMNMEPNVSVTGAELQRRIEEAMESRLEYQSCGPRSTLASSG